MFGGCILLRSLLGFYYSGRQSQQSFLLVRPVYRADNLTTICEPIV
jgi:hypothetical protein